MVDRGIDESLYEMTIRKNVTRLKQCA